MVTAAEWRQVTLDGNEKCQMLFFFFCFALKVVFSCRFSFRQRIGCTVSDKPAMWTFTTWLPRELLMITCGMRQSQHDPDTGIITSIPLNSSVFHLCWLLGQNWKRRGSSYLIRLLNCVWSLTIVYLCFDPGQWSRKKWMSWSKWVCRSQTSQTMHWMPASTLRYILHMNINKWYIPRLKSI